MQINYQASHAPEREFFNEDEKYEKRKGGENIMKELEQNLGKDLVFEEKLRGLEGPNLGSRLPYPEGSRELLRSGNIFRRPKEDDDAEQQRDESARLARRLRELGYSPKDIKVDEDGTPYVREGATPDKK